MSIKIHSSDDFRPQCNNLLTITVEDYKGNVVMENVRCSVLGDNHDMFRLRKMHRYQYQGMRSENGVSHPESAKYLYWED